MIVGLEQLLMFMLITCKGDDFVHATPLCYHFKLKMLCFAHANERHHDCLIPWNDKSLFLLSCSEKSSFSLHHRFFHLHDPFFYVICRALECIRLMWWCKFTALYLCWCIVKKIFRHLQNSTRNSTTYFAIILLHPSFSFLASLFFLSLQWFSLLIFLQSLQALDFLHDQSCSLIVSLCLL